jgi:precorrin-6x reductase
MSARPLPEVLTAAGFTKLPALHKATDAAEVEAMLQVLAIAARTGHVLLLDTGRDMLERFTPADAQEALIAALEVLADGLRAIDATRAMLEQAQARAFACGGAIDPATYQ